MAKINVELCILVDGITPVVGYEIEGLKFSSYSFDESIINTSSMDFMFYTNMHLLKMIYEDTDMGVKKFCVLKNEESFQLEVDDNVSLNKSKLGDFLLKTYGDLPKKIERLLRLKTNIRIGLPIYRIQAFDTNCKLLACVAHMDPVPVWVGISNITDKVKSQLITRLGVNFNMKSMESLSKSNERFMRALEFYHGSFENSDCSVRFVMLMAALESLFSSSENRIKERISIYTSKMHFLDEEAEEKMKIRMKELYKARSEYVHGNKYLYITDDNEYELREIVRNVIIAYWFLSLNNDVSTLNNLMNSIDKVKNSPLDRYQISRLIQMSYAKDFKTFCIDSLKKALEAISEISRCGEGKPI